MDKLPVPAHLAGRTRRNVADQVHTGLGMPTPPSVSIKGGAFTLVDSNGAKEPIETNYLDVVIIDTLPFVNRVYWGRDYTGGENNLAPECWSDNGIGASRNATNPQSTH